MHFIIGTIICIIFVFFLVKAIVETIWGTCLIVYGIACSFLAFLLRIIAKSIRSLSIVFSRRNNEIRQIAQPVRVSVVEAFTRVNSCREQSDRLLPIL